MSEDTFSRDIADIESSITAMGLSPKLYTPGIGIGATEEEAYADPFPPQLLAGLQLFARLFCGDAKKVWAHLTAEMQAGKTGVVCVVLRLVLQNFSALRILYEGVFLITGMSDNAWTKQTRERVPDLFRKNVHHNGNLSQVKEKLIKQAKGAHLKNCLVFLDESHFASSYDNRPAREVFETLHMLCPIELWAENNVRLITISATDPALTLKIADQRHIARDIRLLTTPAYQSVESLKREGRLCGTFALKDEATLRGYLGVLDAKFGAEPLYHILRPQRARNAWVQETLRTIRPDCDVIAWDSSSSSKRSSTTEGSSTSSIEDINDILEVRPTKITFIIIKDMFYASKTLCDTHVGALYDRCGGKDDTNLQSLLGRTCGYGKSKRTMVFTSMETVDNYLKFWRDIATAPTIRGADAAALSGKMAGVVSDGSALGVAHKRATPVVKKGDAPAPAPKAADTDKDHRVFATQDEAIAFAKTTLHYRLSRRRSDEAPKIFLTRGGGKNPTVEAILSRMQGLSEDHPARMIPTEDGSWCVYWRPSLFAKRDEAPPAVGGAGAPPPAPKATKPAAAPATAAPATAGAKAPATAGATGDKSHRVFATQDEAIAFAKETLKKRFNRRALKEDEEVSTVEAVVKSMKGLNESHYARMVPTENGQWCVYWRPSLVPS